MTTLRTIARPYANAVFELALAHNDHTLWHAALNTLQQIWSQPHIAAQLQNPRLHPAFLVDCFTQFDTLAHKPVTKFISLLIQQQRLDIIPELFRLYIAAMNAHDNKLDVQLSSAHPLSEKHQAQIKEKLSTTLHKTILLTTHKEPSLIGGFTLKYHDQVIDNSIAGRLKQLNKQLTEVTYAA